ncbi:MAG: Asp-tRNA(Asn)/Glu-tRNA(Gln) amidotransferase subunit GatB, partial [Chloroflexota bacterium]
EAVKAYAFGLRTLLRYLEVNSGNLEKGLFRIEPNISIRTKGTDLLGTRVEIKNLNSFRSLERGVAYELERQADLINTGQSVVQQTLGWDDEKQVTVPQRSKEDAEDYRYFPEPDLPPLVITDEWIAEIKAALPELPFTKYQRFQESYGLNPYDANVLTTEREVAEYYEAILKSTPDVSPKMAANWVSGELFNLMNQASMTIADLALTPQAVGELIQLVASGEITQNSGKTVLAEMFDSGELAARVVEKKGLKQISDISVIADLVEGVLTENAEQVQKYLAGKDSLSNWLFGQVMRAAKGQANPDILRVELGKQLTKLKSEH